MIDILFIEFYIYKKYKIKLEDYISEAKTVASAWRNKKFPEQRLYEFCYKEGSNNIFELFNNIYKKESEQI